jgi:hypothetical protein
MTYAAFALGVFQLPFLWNLFRNARGREPGTGNGEPGRNAELETRIAEKSKPVCL